MTMANLRLLFPIHSFNLLCTRRLSAMQDTVASKLKRSIEKDLLPPRPKKPLSPFLQYLQSVRSKLQKEHPNFAYQDIIKKASEQWAQIAPTVKEDFQKQYVEQHSVYKQKLIDYKNSITDDQKMLIRTELIKKGDALEKSKIKQKLTELGKPKRPLTAFFIFLQNKRSTKDPQISQQDWICNVSNEWKTMTIEAKNKYVEQAAQLLDQYKNEFKKWEENMVQTGHSDLLKSSSKTKRNADIGNKKTTDQSKKDIKISWGTDIACFKSKNIIDAKNVNLNQQYKIAKDLVPYNDRNNLQDLIKNTKTAIEDKSLHDVTKSVVQPHNTPIKISVHKNFAWKYITENTFVGKRFLIVLTEVHKNKKMVREYVFIGISAILIAIFCVLNLMYK